MHIYILPLGEREENLKGSPVGVLFCYSHRPSDFGFWFWVLGFEYDLIGCDGIRWDQDCRFGMEIEVEGFMR